MDATPGTDALEPDDNYRLADRDDTLPDLEADRQKRRPKAKIVRQVELVEKVLFYDPSADEAALNRAYVFAVQRHGDQERASGDPYYGHPVAVSDILADLKLDANVIMAGLLHDTVEDTDTTVEEIASLFNPDVAALVDGVTKLGQISYSSQESKQAENFQKFILATTRDIRVLLVKLADRLHNMETLHFIKKLEKRERIAQETMDLYAPLARRIGAYEIGSRLEDLAFAHIAPQARAALQMRLDEMARRNAPDLSRIEADLRALLDCLGIEYELKGRRKQTYSIWRKLQRKDISFKDVADIHAFRVIVPRREDCYRVLGALHLHWHCLPDRFRDFVSAPKPNGYQSLHTTVTATGNRRVEVQIRTPQMDETARNGVAAHWTYKNAVYGFDADAAREAGIDAERELRTFAEMLEHGADAEEFLEHAKLEMYKDHVFTFTPKGRLVVLPSGAMPLDFAYAVHTALGDTCDGAKINGDRRSLRTKLRNGDRVDIIRADHKRPLGGWEALTMTGRAKSAQRRLVRQRRRENEEGLGRSMLDTALRRVSIDPVDLDTMRVARRCGHENLPGFYRAIANGELATRDVLVEAFPGLADDEDIWADRLVIGEHDLEAFVAGADPSIGHTMQLCGACRPVPGDRIVGTRQGKSDVEVHAIDCGRLDELDQGDAEWLDLRWTALALRDGAATGRIRMRALHKKGVLATLCAAVAETGGNITGIETGERNPDFIDVHLDVEVQDLRHLTQIVTALRSLSVIDTVERERA